MMPMMHVEGQEVCDPRLYTSNTAVGDGAGKLRQETRDDARGLTTSRSNHFKLDPLDLDSAVPRLSADLLQPEI